MTEQEILHKDFIDVNGNKRVLTLGDKVRYIPNHAKNNRNHPDCEVGIVTSFGDKNCFVRYTKQHPEANGQATLYRDLELY